MPRLSLTDNYKWGDTGQRNVFLHLWTDSIFLHYGFVQSASEGPLPFPTLSVGSSPVNVWAKSGGFRKTFHLARPPAYSCPPQGLLEVPGPHFDIPSLKSAAPANSCCLWDGNEHEGPELKSFVTDGGEWHCRWPEVSKKLMRREGECLIQDRLLIKRHSGIRE